MAAGCGRADRALNSSPRKKSRKIDPELGDEVGHLRGPDEAERLRLVRAQKEPCEQVGGDRREAEAARDEPEACQQGDGDRELGERERRRRGERQSAPILRR